MLSCLALMLVLLGLLAYRLTATLLAPALAILLVVSNLELTTLVTRFYTFHYVLGAVFALGAALLFFDRDASKLSKLSSALLLLLALLAKEVYALLLILFIVLALRRKDWLSAVASTAAGLLYLSWRFTMLGMPGAAEAGSSYFTYPWQVESSAWINFLQWYFSARLLIWLAVISALVINPRPMLFYLTIALLLLAPVTAASHGMLQPELHADRLYFAFDSMLALGAGIALATAGPLRSLTRKTATSLLAIMGVTVVASQILYANSVRASNVATTDYKITRYITDNYQELDNKVVYVPLQFTQGDLQSSLNRLQLSSVELTHNCIRALQVKEDALLVFDASGELADLSELELECQQTPLDINVINPPQYRNKSISWHIEVPEGYLGGVYFLDRNLPVPMTEFSRVLARPTESERVQLFATRGNEWWFSQEMALQFSDSVVN
jgi:hypothetical protein